MIVRISSVVWVDGKLVVIGFRMLVVVMVVIVVELVVNWMMIVMS